MFKRPNDSSKLDDVIDELLSELKGYQSSDEEYGEATAQLERLYKLRDGERPERISKDTLTVVAGNLIGILVIVGYEQKHAMVSKALSFVKFSR